MYYNAKDDFDDSLLVWISIGKWQKSEHHYITLLVVLYDNPSPHWSSMWNTFPSLSCSVIHHCWGWSWRCKVMDFVSGTSIADIAIHWFFTIRPICPTQQPFVLPELLGGSNNLRRKLKKLRGHSYPSTYSHHHHHHHHFFLLFQRKHEKHSLKFFTYFMQKRSRR